MDDKFLLGVIASEGCFSVNNTVVRANAFGVQARFMFDIGMRYRDEKLINTLRDTVGVGEVSENSDMVRWRVRRHADIDEFIEWMENRDECGFQYCDKYSSYTAWRDLWAERDELMKTERGMKELTRRSANINSNDARRGRTVEEIHEIIEENG